MVHRHYIKEDQDYIIAKPIIHLAPTNTEKGKRVDVALIAEVTLLLKNESNSERSETPLTGTSNNRLLL
jgi:hypothetical protein